jgi:hypothetical protein
MKNDAIPSLIPPPGAPRLGASCPTGADGDASASPDGAIDAWLDALERRSGLATRGWPRLDDDALDLLFASAGRLFGVEDVLGRPAAEAARVALLALRARRANGTAASIVTERFRSGDNDERVAVLRALPHLPEPDRFLALAIHACRTNVTPVFEAIACENPYPAAFFPERAFNQMVLKALFVGVRVGRIVGLDRRHNQELARMAAGYASERRAAGRPVPSDVTILSGGPSR